MMQPPIWISTPALGTNSPTCALLLVAVCNLLLMISLSCKETLTIFTDMASITQLTDGACR